MKRVAVSLLALGVLGVAGDRALAQAALSRPMAAHVAANYGIQYAGLPGQAQRRHARQYQYRSRYRHHGRPAYRYPRGHGAVIVHPPVRHYPVAVYPPVYSSYPYYYAPYGGLTYHGRRFSIGIGF